MIELRSTPSVTLVKSNADDNDVAMSAWVSFNNDSEERLQNRKQVKGLINFLYRNQHMTPFEHSVFTFRIECPIFVAREIFRHRSACVAGDTVVRLCQSNGNIKESRYKDIETIWEHWHLGVPDSKPSKKQAYIKYRKRFNDWRVWYVDTTNKQHKIVELGIFTDRAAALEKFEEVNGSETYRRRKLPSTRNINAVVMDETTGELVSNKVLDVIKSGIKPVYEVTTDTGMKIKTTMEHRFRTPNGYLMLKDLSVGDKIMAAGKVWPEGRDPLVSKELRAGIGHWTQQIKKDLISRDSKTQCYICEAYFKYEDIHLDHVIPVISDLSKALDPRNLKPACHRCHRSKTNLEQRLSYRRGCVASAIEVVVNNIEYVGEEMTYDLTMESPNNNFLANSFVVHNSYNEMSGRYTKLIPTFYVPNSNRPVVQQGKTGDYSFAMDISLNAVSQTNLRAAYETCWNAYENMLDLGVAKEVARMCLPVGIYTQFYMTLNARNLMHFLDLRCADQALYEIRQVADEMSRLFEKQMPITFEAWNATN